MKASFSILILLTAIAAATGAVDANSAANLVYTDILVENITGKSIMVLDRALTHGSKVETWHDEVTVPFNGYLVLIDDMAYANWEHPCRWVFVSTNGEMEIIRMIISSSVSRTGSIPIPTSRAG